MRKQREALTHWNGNGSPKVGFDKREDALAQRQRLLDYDLDNGRLMTMVSIYECRDCGL